jgi:splicing factor 3B subunit 1
MDAIDAELARAQEERRKVEEALAAGAPMAVSSVTFDTDLYGGGGADPDRFAGYDTSIPASKDAAAEDEPAAPAPRRLATYTGHAIAAADLPRSADGHDDGLGLPKRSQRIIDREDDYRRRRLNKIISPERHDPFAAGEATRTPRFGPTPTSCVMPRCRRRRRTCSGRLLRRRRKRRRGRPPPPFLSS